MARQLKKRSKKAGLPPGTLVHIGEQKSERAELQVLCYGTGDVLSQSISSPRDVAAQLGEYPVVWLDVDAVHDVSVVEQIGAVFGLHSLLLEDMVNTDQRPKVEEYGDYLFVVLKMLGYDEASGEVTSEQVSFVLGKGVLLSVGEREGDVFEPVRERIREARGKIRSMGADYLLYRLIDAIVDRYFWVIEQLGERIESLEDRVISDTDSDVLREIALIRREMLYLRRSVWPLREVLSELRHEEYSLIQEQTEIYYRDVYDHTIQIIDTVETSRDTLAGMMDLYQSNVNFRLNAVMKVLTVISTIFLPLTFVAGIWGMNFVNMPELYWQYAYFLALGIMAVVAAVMIVIFRKKKWI